MFQNVKGTTDFYPEDLRIRQHVFDRWKTIAKRYDFQEVESPVMESIELLTKKEGEDTVSQIFTLEKRGTEKLGLRFDLTVPIARMFVSRQKETKLPAKWFQLSRMWRYEQPQAGRLREFYQLSVELFGSNSCDYEIIMFAIDALRSLDLSDKDFVVRINSRKLLEGLLGNYVKKKNIPDAIRIIDKRQKISDEEFVKEISQYIDGKSWMDSVLAVNKICELLKIKDLTDIDLNDLDDTAKEGYDEIRIILETIPGEYKKCIELDLGTARGLSYYTGFVFEIFDKQGKYRALAGGGRYDLMIEQFGGEACPACGFGIGYSTVLLLLTEKGLLPDDRQATDYYVAPVSHELKREALAICMGLRKKGFSAEMDLMERKLRKQLEYASGIGAKKVVIVGRQDLDEGCITVRDMKTGSEDKVRIDEL